MSFQQYPFKGGVPTGTTAQRPGSPATGDVFYNGTEGILEIYNGTAWVPCSAPAGTPVVTATDVGTSRAYTSGAISFTFTPQTTGGAPLGYTGVATTASTATVYQSTTTSTTLTLAVGAPGVYTFYGNAYNGFGTSPNAVPSTVAVTTVPQAPTIGTATLSNGLPVVNWTFGNNGGKNITSITITPYLNGTTAQTPRTAATTSSTSYTFTTGQLTEDASYTFKVKVTNANGDSLESSASNSVTVNESLTVEYLVVAGGASGGGGGGGGAGGYRTGSNFSIAAGTGFTVTVGAGGTALTTNGKGNAGSNSVFSTITASGGGGGGEYIGGSGNCSGNSGGSGGGGGWNNESGADAGGSGNSGGYTPVEGYAGGSSGTNALQYTAGGGGGSAAVGANATSSASGNGGAGTLNSILGTSYYWAGGGGAGSQGPYQAGNGGIGGGGGGSCWNSSGTYHGTGGGSALNAGGNGQTNTTETGNVNTAGSGGANTGGGGGGMGISVKTSGAGGSGIVVLKVASSQLSETVGAGLTYTKDTTTTSGYTIYRFTAGTGTVTLS